MAFSTPREAALVLNPRANRPSLSTALITSSAQGGYSEWYLGNSSRRWSEPAKDAYEAAVEILSKELTPDEFQDILIHTHNSLQAVQNAVSLALKEYKTKAKSSKTRILLSSCSSRIMYYGAIFDMFSNHHPEYVSLAWGALKFLFVAVLNHEELLVEVSSAVSRVADVLPRTELLSVLYPTERMQEAVARLYAKIIEFAVMTIKWCKQSKLKHTISAIVKPFSLSFKPIIDEMTERSRRVDELANAAFKAEIRDLHANIHELKDKVNQLTQVMIAYRSLQDQVMLDIRDQKQFFQDAKLEDIRNIMLLENTPDSDQSLAYYRSLRNRRRKRFPSQLPSAELTRLKAWITDPSSSLLLAEGRGIKTSSLDFAADFLDAVLERGYPVLWSLPPTSGGVPSVKGILRSLILQSLSRNPSIISDRLNPVTTQHIKSATTVDLLFKLLENCLSCFPALLLLIDIGSVDRAIGHAVDEWELFHVGDFVERISELVDRGNQGGLKVIIVSWRFGSTTSLKASEIFGKKQIFTDRGRSMERLMRQPKFKAVFRQRNKRTVEGIRSTVGALDTDAIREG